MPRPRVAPHQPRPRLGRERRRAGQPSSAGVSERLQVGTRARHPLGPRHTLSLGSLARKMGVMLVTLSASQVPKCFILFIPAPSPGPGAWPAHWTPVTRMRLAKMGARCALCPLRGVGAVVQGRGPSGKPLPGILEPPVRFPPVLGRAVRRLPSHLSALSLGRKRR